MLNKIPAHRRNMQLPSCCSTPNFPPLTYLTANSQPDLNKPTSSRSNRIDVPKPDPDPDPDPDFPLSRAPHRPSTSKAEITCHPVAQPPSNTATGRWAKLNDTLSACKTTPVACTTHVQLPFPHRPPSNMHQSRLLLNNVRLRHICATRKKRKVVNRV